MNELQEENKELKRKLDIAIEAMRTASSYLACMDDLYELTGHCNEQMALEELIKALEKLEKKGE